MPGCNAIIIRPTSVGLVFMEFGEEMCWMYAGLLGKVRDNALYCTVFIKDSANEVPIY